MTYPAAVVASLVLLTACASTPPPQASAPIEWSKVAAEEVPEIVTIDPDGAARETKLWVVVVDGTGYLRTSGTRWLRNLDQDPTKEFPCPVKPSSSRASAPE